MYICFIFINSIFYPITYLIQSCTFLVSPEVGHAVSVEGEDITPVITPGQSVILRWNPLSLIPKGFINNVTVDISFNFLNHKADKGTFTSMSIPTPLVKNTANDGEESLSIDYRAFVVCTSITLYTVCPIYINISISSDQYLSSDISIWSGTLFLQGEFNPFLDSLSEQCQNWYTETQPIIARLEELPHCPPNELIASFDLNYMREDMTSFITSSMEYHDIFMKYFHSGINECYVQSM